MSLYLGSDKHQNKETLELANRIKAKRELEYDTIKHGFSSPVKKRYNLAIYYEKIAVSKDSYSSWVSSLKFLKQFDNRITIGLVDEVWLEKYKDYLLSKIAQNTASLYFRYLKHVLNISVREKILASNPAKNVSNIKQVESQRAYLTIEEIKKLNSTPCKYSENKRAFLFACYTGMRYSDIVKLTWGNFKDGQLQFRQKKTKGFEYIPLSETALKFINNTPSNILYMPDELIFKIPNRMALIRDLKKWAKSAKINKNLTFHVARHTFATLAITSGVDLYTVSKILGHRSISTTQIYAKIIDEKKRLAVNILPKIEVIEK